MVYVGVVISLLGVIAGFFTAYYMRTQVISSLPIIEGDISDLHGAEVRNSLAAKLQEEGYFVLNLKIIGGNCNFLLKKIKVKGALIGELPLYNFDGICESSFKNPKTNSLSLYEVSQRNLDRNLSFLIKTDKPEEGKIKVSISIGLFSSITATIPYVKTSYFG